MLSIQISRWSGLALIIGSVLFIVNKFNDMSQAFFNNPIPDLITGQSFVLLAIGQIGLAAGLSGCYLVYAGRVNRTGKIALGLLASGGVLLAIGHISFTPNGKFESFFALVLLGTFLILMGITLFGAINLRARVLQVWQPLPLVTGIIGIAAFFIFGGKQIPVIFLTLRTLFGVGLVLLGMVMWQDKRQPGIQQILVTGK